MDVAEFSALDCEVAAQLDLPCTLIGGVFSTHPIKRHISRVSWPIKPPNTLIVSPIKDRVVFLLYLYSIYSFSVCRILRVGLYSYYI
jgi:hypothetical protein